MRVCLVVPPGPAVDGAASVRRLATLLSRRHEVTLISLEEDGEGPCSSAPYRELRADPRPIRRTVFAGIEHLRSAAVMEAIAVGYADSPPDYVEVADRCARGLVALMARRCADPSLAETRFAVRLLGSAELRGLHDGAVADADFELCAALEREQLRLADLLISPGDDVLGLYRSFYALPFGAAADLPLPLEPGAAVGAGRPEGPLRILYLGDLSRAGGALDLAEAALRLPLDDWRLSMYGADTATAPIRQSVRMTVEAMFDGDPRLNLIEPGEGPEPDLEEHDLLVVPPTFAIWPETALQAIAAGMPTLATPVGILQAAVGGSAAGRLTAGTGAEAIRRALIELIERPDQLAEARTAGGGEVLRRIIAPEAVLEGYERLLGEGAAAQRSPRKEERKPLVTAVIPYFRASAFVEEALRSFFAQTHGNLEAVIVNDGSFDQADRLLDRLGELPRVRVVTQLNEGESVARNLGARLARGDFVVMLDSDNLLEPEFVSRALAVYEREPDLAYVSCWLRIIAPDGSLHAEPAGYAPLGNSLVTNYEENWDGDTLALVPRETLLEEWGMFDPEALVHGDWDRYRRLRENGRFGVVIPEYLGRYRLVASSLMRAYSSRDQDLGWSERPARRRLRETEWTAGAPE